MTRARDVANLIGSGNYSSTTFTATAGQTAFTISHTQGFIQVFMNGLLLDETADYTSNGSAVTLTSGAAAGDEIEVVAYNTFSVGDALNQAAADTRYVNTTGDTMTGNLGIGAAPTRALHVEHATDATMIVNAAAGNQATYLLGEGGASKFNMSHKASDDTFQIYNYYNNGISLKIDSSGRVTKPYQPAFKASIQTNAANPRTTTNTIYVTPYDTTQLNVGNHYNTSTYRFTAPVAGNYHFSISQNKIGKLIIYFYKNGNVFHAGEFLKDTNPDWEHCTISCVIPLAASDYVEARTRLNNNSGTQYAYNGGSPTWDSFSGYLIG